MQRKQTSVIWTPERIREQALVLARLTAPPASNGEEAQPPGGKQTREALSPFWAWRVMRRR